MTTDADTDTDTDAAITSNPIALLSLLQLSSATLPVGAYSYSEGLEFVIESGRITTAAKLRSWLTQELNGGSVRVDGAVMVRVHRAVMRRDRAAIAYWNAWLAAMRETAELRRQNEQMGRALADLWRSLDAEAAPWFETGSHPVQTQTQAQAQAQTQAQIDNNGLPTMPIPDPTKPEIQPEIQFAIAFGITAARSGIDAQSSVIGFLQSWVTNTIGAGVKLIPLGQTDGQRVLRALGGAIELAASFAIVAGDDDLETTGWGLTLASMQHETQRVRLFRS